MKRWITLFCLMMTCASASLLAQEQIVVVYIAKGDSGADAAAMAELNSRASSMNDSGHSYLVTQVTSVSGANAYANSGVWDHAFVVAHGIEEGNPNLNTIDVNGTPTNAAGLSANFDDEYYCFKDGGGTITIADAMQGVENKSESEH